MRTEVTHNEPNNDVSTTSPTAAIDNNNRFRIEQQKLIVSIDEPLPDQNQSETRQQQACQQNCRQAKTYQLDAFFILAKE